jgi:hypothetical protein
MLISGQPQKRGFHSKSCELIYQGRLKGLRPFTITLPLSFEGIGITWRVKERRSLSYITNSPSPLKERGIKGVR